MSLHRVLDVKVKTPSKTVNLKGQNCMIIDKTLPTRFGMAFEETIYCEQFSTDQKK